MADKNRDEVGEWLQSTGGTVSVTVVFAMVAVGLGIYMPMTLNGWHRWLCIVAEVALLGWLAWRFVRPERD